MVIALLLAACAPTTDESTPGTSLGTMDPVRALTRTSLDQPGGRPSPGEVAQVQADPAALDTLTDQFLADPRFADRVRDMWSEVYLTSGVVAVIFATMVFMNFFNAALFLKRPLVPVVFFGGLIGIGGVALLFWPEFGRLSIDDTALRGLLLALASTYVASLGSILATRNAVFGLKVITVNAWGMFYGTALLTLAALVTGAEFRFPAGLPYTASLLYLSVFGSIVAFGAFLRLIALIGPERAGYNAMMTPLVS